MRAHFINGPFDNTEMVLPGHVQQVLELAAPQPPLTNVDPHAPVDMSYRTVQYRYVSSGGGVAYYVCAGTSVIDGLHHGRLSRRSPWEQRVPRNEIYAQAQQVDAWPGDDYEGTSITLDAIRAVIAEHHRSAGPVTPAPVPAWLRERQEQYRRHIESCWLMRRDPDATSPDSMTVRFSEMSAEAEAELEAWDEMLNR